LNELASWVLPLTAIRHLENYQFLAFPLAFSDRNGKEFFSWTKLSLCVCTKLLGNKCLV
jgi:hypothetical protein